MFQIKQNWNHTGFKSWEDKKYICYFKRGLYFSQYRCGWFGWNILAAAVYQTHAADVYFYWTRVKSQTRLHTMNLLSSQKLWMSPFQSHVNGSGTFAIAYIPSFYISISFLPLFSVDIFITSDAITFFVSNNGILYLTYRFFVE